MNKDALELQIASLRQKHEQIYDSIKSVEKMISVGGHSEKIEQELKQLLEMKMTTKKQIAQQLHDTEMRLKQLNKSPNIQAAGSAESDILDNYGHLHRGVIDEELKLELISRFGMNGYMQLPF